jgi:hypothetical protein
MDKLEYLRNWRAAHHDQQIEYYQRYRNNNKLKCKEIHDRYYNNKKLLEPNWVRDKSRQYRFKKRNPFIVKVFKQWSTIIDPNYYNNIIRISLLKKYFKKWVIYKTKFLFLRKFFQAYKKYYYKSKYKHQVVDKIVVNFSF